MPYGTVNLLHGVNPGETPVTCTAGIGTFIVEFATLSHLTGDPVFEDVARKALKALWKNRSDIGLVSEEWPGNLLPCFRCSFVDAVLRVEEPEPCGDRTRQMTPALMVGWCSPHLQHAQLCCNGVNPTSHHHSAPYRVWLGTDPFCWLLLFL